MPAFSQKARRFVRFGSVLGLAAAFGGCTEDSPTEAGPEVTSVQIVTAVSTMEVGATVQLAAEVREASASQAVTWSSGDESVATVNGSGLVEAVAPGTVTITATSVAATSFSDEVSIVVTGCPAPREVSGVMGSDATWENWVANPTCFDYVVTGNVNNQGSLLTIEPGVAVGFQANSLVIRGAAGLLAAGTEQEPIRFSGTTNQRGHWNGILLDGTEHELNRIEHVTIEHAGVGSWSGSVVKANLMIRGSSTTLLNVTSRESAAYGLSLMAGARLREHGENTFTENALGPAHARGSNAHFLEKTSRFDGNDSDLVLVLPTDIDETVTWSPIGDGYLILRRFANYAFNVKDGGWLTLEPGVLMLFQDDMGLLVGSDGALTAVGSQDAPIVFRGEEEVAGYWRGLRFISGDARNELDHVTIAHGGSDTHSGSVRPHNLYFAAGSGGARVSNTVLRDGIGYGLYAPRGTRLEAFTGNQLTGNALGPAFVDAPVAGQLLASSMYTGNGNDVVTVYGYTSRITEPATWQDLGVPYRVDDAPRGLYVDAELTLEEGVEILFPADLGLAVVEGSLVAHGTMQNPIRFAADGASWQGIHVVRGQASFEYATIENAGGVKWGGVSVAGAVTVTASAGTTSTAAFGPGASQSGADWGLVFGYGQTFGVECVRMGAIYVHPGDEVSDHC